MSQTPREHTEQAGHVTDELFVGDIRLPLGVTRCERPEFSDPGEALQWVKNELTSLRDQDQELKDQFLNLYRGIQDLRLSRGRPSSAANTSFNSTATSSSTLTVWPLTSFPVRESPFSEAADAMHHKVDQEENKARISSENQKYHDNKHSFGATNVASSQELSPPPLPADAANYPCTPRQIRDIPSLRKPVCKQSFTAKLKKQIWTACFNSAAAVEYEKPYISNIMGSAIKVKRKIAEKISSSNGQQQAPPDGHLWNSAKIQPFTDQSHVFTGTYSDRTDSQQANPMRRQSAQCNILNNPAFAQAIATTHAHQTRRVASENTLSRIMEEKGAATIHKPKSRGNLHGQSRTLSDPNFQSFNKQQMYSERDHVTEYDDRENFSGSGQIERVRYLDQGPDRQRSGRKSTHHALRQSRDVSEHNWSKSSLSLFSPNSMQLDSSYYSVSDDETYSSRSSSSSRWSRPIRHRRSTRRAKRFILSPLAESVELNSSFYSQSDGEATLYESRRSHRHHRRHAARRQHRYRKRRSHVTRKSDYFRKSHRYVKEEPVLHTIVERVENHRKPLGQWSQTSIEDAMNRQHGHEPRMSNKVILTSKSDLRQQRRQMKVRSKYGSCSNIQALESSDRYPRNGRLAYREDKENYNFEPNKDTIGVLRPTTRRRHVQNSMPDLCRFTSNHVAVRSQEEYDFFKDQVSCGEWVL